MISRARCLLLTEFTAWRDISNAAAAAYGSAHTHATAKATSKYQCVSMINTLTTCSSASVQLLEGYKIPQQTKAE